MQRGYLIHDPIRITAQARNKQSVRIRFRLALNARGVKPLGSWRDYNLARHLHAQRHYGTRNAVAPRDAKTTRARTSSEGFLCGTNEKREERKNEEGTIGWGRGGSRRRGAKGEP